MADTAAGFGSPGDAWAPPVNFIGTQAAFLAWTDYDNVIVGVNKTDKLPSVYSLSQNYPNPFNPSTSIEFAIPRNSEVTLKIYNTLGQEVRTLINEQMSAGSYNYDFDASSLSSGVYFYTLKAGDFVQSKKMILLK